MDFHLIALPCEKEAGDPIYVQIDKVKDSHAIVVGLTPCTGGGGTMCLLCEL